VARPRITFSDDQMRGMIAAASAADRDSSPSQNADFLDRLIAGIARCTGRIYGQSTYQRLLDAFQIRRRPSAQTWSKAIQRAHDSGVGLPEPLSRPQFNLPESSVQPSIAPSIAIAAGSVPLISDEELIELKSRAQVAESALRDAYFRISALESQRITALERATAAEAQSRVAAEQLENERSAHATQIQALMKQIDGMARTVERLTGLERHLHLQTDALRQEMSQQRDLYRSRAEAAEKALALERTQTDAMRRVLGNRAANLPAGAQPGSAATPGARFGS
jgi:hypothetical protein